MEALPDIPRRVLVLMGGTDPTRSAVTVGLACSDAFPLADVTVVSPAPAGSKTAVRVVPRIEDMATAMSDADLVVTAAGSTLWEVCCLGRPAAAVQVADNQRDVYGRLSASGIVHGLGEVPVDRFEVAARLRALTAERGALRRLASAAARLVDGRGAERVIKELEARMERQS
jgi:spore coat polysaccharide biosynthesis predicted glycosyltransferase SpsG